MEDFSEKKWGRGMKRISGELPTPSGELTLIDQIRQASGRPRGAVKLGIGDDCAILRPPAGCEILVTTDFTLENRHFRRDLHPAGSVGHRCLARGLSDLAAMGAKPLAAFLSLALPADLLATAKGRRWVADFFQGLRVLGDRYQTPLAGGDTSESPSGLILADITLIGAAPAGRALRRSTAHAGDLLYCSGHLGGSAAELEDLFAKGKLAHLKSPLSHPHLLPEPRLAVGATLWKRKLATACLDLSDGLSTDLAHLCDESGLSAEVDQTAIPIHPLAACLGPEKALELALNGGEDYELLFTAASSVKMPSKISGVPITPIGRIKLRRPGTPQISLIHPDGSQRPLLPGGWQHFTSKETTVTS